MKKMKRFFALFLAMAMVLGMSMTTFAADITKPAEGDKDWVTITGITPDQATFRAYQIIKPDFKSGVGFSGYKWVDGYNGGNAIEIVADNSTTEEDESKVNGLTNIVGLNSTNINTWAKNPVGTPEVFENVDEITMKATTNGTKLYLGVGTWMILVTPKTNVDVVYNPMVASVYYVSETSTNGGTVDGDGQWKLETSDAYVKSTDLTGENDKQVVELQDGEYTAAEAGAAVGTKLTYQLTGLIPSYGPEYFADNAEVVYRLKDRIVNGLEYDESSVQVFVGTNSEKLTVDTDYTLTWTKKGNEPATGFSIQLTKSYLEKVATKLESERKIKVIYNAEITTNAVSEIAENKFGIDFTREPGVVDTATPDNETTAYSFTASINGIIKKTNGEDLLPGATFTLYGDADKTEVVGTDKTDDIVSTDAINETGNVQFKGLEFGKTYYLQETEAPQGYSINNTVYEITCNYPEGFDPKGGKAELTNYNVTIVNTSLSENDENYSKTINVTYGGSDVVLDSAYEIVNTTLTALPSTGGIGTTIFTVGGCAIMILAAGMFFVSRRRAAK